MEQRKKIILVDDQIVNLTLGRETLAAKYDVYTVPSGEKLLLLLKKIMPDMILLDIEMPDMNGYETIKKLKDNPETVNIPVVFLTARNDTGSELNGLSLGAVDFISKPFSPPLLLKRLELHLLLTEQKRELEKYNTRLEEMVREKTKTILNLQNAVMETMAELVECRDDVTGGHIGRTRAYLEILINEMLAQGLYSEETSKWDIDILLMSAQLHDVGKIAISDNILKKPDKLTPEEFEEIKKHTVFGGSVIARIKKRTGNQEFLDYANILAVHHHEKWDGTGYPHGLAGKDIPLPARLMAVVDVYDALVAARPYKPPFPHSKAVRIITEGKGTQFDPALVDLFLSAAHKMEQAGGLVPKPPDYTAKRETNEKD